MWADCPHPRKFLDRQRDQDYTTLKMPLDWPALALSWLGFRSEQSEVFYHNFSIIDVPLSVVAGAIPFGPSQAFRIRAGGS